ncbi:MAG: hypothetical protein AAGJ46_13840 [Planctomycetota bacterium]
MPFTHARLLIAFAGFFALSIPAAEATAAPIELHVEVSHAGGVVASTGPPVHTSLTPRPAAVALPTDLLEVSAESVHAIHTHTGWSTRSELTRVGNEILWKIWSVDDAVGHVGTAMTHMGAGGMLGSLEPGDYVLRTMYMGIEEPVSLRDVPVCLMVYMGPNQPSLCPSHQATLTTPEGYAETPFTVVPEPAAAALLLPAALAWWRRR